MQRDGLRARAIHGEGVVEKAPAPPYCSLADQPLPTRSCEVTIAAGAGAGAKVTATVATASATAHSTEEKSPKD